MVRFLVRGLSSATRRGAVLPYLVFPVPPRRPASPLTTSGDWFRVFSPSPTVAARVRFLAPFLNGFQRFAIPLYSLFFFLRAACTPFAVAPQRPRRRLILHAYAYPWRAPRARPPPHLPLRGSNSRPPAPIPGDQGFCLRRHRALVLPWCGAAAVPLLNKL